MRSFFAIAWTSAFLGCTQTAERPPLTALPSQFVSAGESPGENRATSYEAPNIRCSRTPSGLLVIQVEREGDVSVAMLATAVDASRLEDQLVLRVAHDVLERETPFGFDAWYTDTATHHALTLRAQPEQLAQAGAFLVQHTGSPTSTPEEFVQSVGDHLKNFVENAYTGHARTSVVARMAMYGDTHPYARDAKEVVGDLVKLGRAHVLARIATLFAPERSALILVGPRGNQPVLARSTPVDPQTLHSEHRPQHLVDIPLREEADAWDIRAFWVRDDQALVRVMHLGPDMKNPEFPAFVVAAELLGDRFASPNASLRHRDGDTYGVGSELVFRAPATEVFWGGYVSAGRAIDALTEHRDAIHALRAGEVQATALERVKQRLKLRSMLAWTSADGIAETLAQRWSLSLNLFRAPLDFSSVRHHDVQKAAERYFRAEDFVVAVQGPPSRLYRLLGAYGTVTSHTME